MNTVNFILQKFGNTELLNQQYNSTAPYPYIILDNFLPQDLALRLEAECVSLDDGDWKKFDRNGSAMSEFNDLSQAPAAYDLVSAVHGQQLTEWLSKVTGITGIIPDPHLMGAGYSRIYRGETLKSHTDFNWNERLKLHRAVNLIIYLNSNWQSEYNGSLELRDFENKEVVAEIEPVFNRCVIWPYHKLGFHGMSKPVLCPDDVSRNTFRFFFYTSNSQHLADDPPHRSQYWFDPDSGQPYDVR